MESAKKSLWSALRRVARPEKPLDLLAAVWPLMVGRRLSLHTRPIAWSKGRVDVAVDQPEWQSQLESMGKDVRKQVNKWWGSELVREVRFLPEKSQGMENRNSKLEARNARPGAGGSRKRGPDATLPRTPENKLGAALKALEPALRGIADGDLRDLISRVAAKYLGDETGRQDAGATHPGKQDKK